VGRLSREIQALDDFLTQAAVRTPGTSMKLPRTSKLLDEMLETNKLNALKHEERQRLIGFLMTVKSKAPVLHMSFSADPTPLFVQRLTTYLRQEIHPLVLVQIGLQPNIGAGCVLRTTNKYFDFSLRRNLKDKHQILLSKINGESESTEVNA
jgi:F0F1-type ATP synthase delta subunit